MCRGEGRQCHCSDCRGRRNGRTRGGELLGGRYCGSWSASVSVVDGMLESSFWGNRGRGVEGKSGLLISEALLSNIVGRVG